MDLLAFLFYISVVPSLCRSDLTVTQLPSSFYAISSCLPYALLLRPPNTTGLISEIRELFAKTQELSGTYNRVLCVFFKIFLWISHFPAVYPWSSSVTLYNLTHLHHVTDTDGQNGSISINTEPCVRDSLTVGNISEYWQHSSLDVGSALS
jgi:hypothetical protein